MTIDPIACRFYDQFYDEMAVQCMGIYRGDRLCYCPYGCGKLYTKSYMYQIRAFLPSSEGNHKTGDHHSIPPPSRDGTHLPPLLGRASKKGLTYPKSRRTKLIDMIIPKKSKRKHLELENHPPEQQYFYIQTRDNGDSVSPLKFPSAVTCSRSADFELNMEAFTFDQIPIGATNDPSTTIKDKSDQAHVQSRKKQSQATIHLDRSNTFGPATLATAEPDSTTTIRESISNANTSSSSTVAPEIDDNVSPEITHDSAITVSVSNGSKESLLLVKEMRSLRKLLQYESNELIAMAKHHKRQLDDIEEYTEMYVNSAAYIQQLKYDIEKLKDQTEDLYLEAEDTRQRQNRLIDQYFRDKESRRLINRCKRLLSLAH